MAENMRKITAVWTGRPGLPGTTTMYFDETDLALGDLLDGLDEFWHGIVTMGGSGSSGLATGLTITLDPVIPIVDPDTGETVGTQFISETHSYTGNGTGEFMPPANQLLIEWRTGTYFGGRELRGRTFLGCLTEDQSNAGVPFAATLSTVGGLANSLALESMVIYSPTKHQRAGAVSATVWNQFAVLRSRRD